MKLSVLTCGVYSGGCPRLLGDHFGEDTDVLEILHWCTKIKVFDVDSKIAGAFVGIGDGAVDVQLGVKHGDGGRTGVARVDKLVSSGGHADAMQT
jgi:hypothetical protein